MSNQQQPDWHALADKFDLWVPHIAPVGEAMLAQLPVQAGDKVLDVASGTGEPALTLARREAHIDICGIDAAAGMAEAAQRKVSTERLSNIRFEAMPAEHIRWPDANFDALLCRFGVMLFENPQQGLNEMARVLKPGGHYSIAVWDELQHQTTMRWGADVFRNKIPKEQQPTYDKATALGAEGVLEAMLVQAGFSSINIERHRFDYQFQSFDDYWNMLEASDMMKQQFDAITDVQKSQVRDEMAQFAAEFVTDQGLITPHQFVLAYGCR